MSRCDASLFSRIRGSSAFSVSPTVPTTPMSRGQRFPSASGRMSTCAILALLGIELPIRKIRAQHEKRVAALYRLVARGETEKAGHSHIERIVVFEMLLAAERVNDGGLQFAGKFDDGVVLAGASGAAEDRDACRAVQQSRKLLQLVLTRLHHGRSRQEPSRRRRRKRLQSDVARDARRPPRRADRRRRAWRGAGFAAIAPGC